MKKIIEIELFKHSFSLIIKYLQNKDQNNVLNKNLNPTDLNSMFDISLSEKGYDSQHVLDLIEKSLNYSVNTSHPLFMNQLYGGTNLISILGDIFASILNTSMYTYEVAPLMTLIEKECIKKLGGLIGYQSSTFDGTFTAGGSISNISAMLLAKDKRFPDSKNRGLKDTPLFSIFISELAHYSFLKGSRILGFGDDSIVKVVTDETGKIKTDALLLAINVEKERGRIPLMVVATAGTTINGVFDDLTKLAEISILHDMWLHTDACYGGSLLFSDLYKNNLIGINLSDSVSWNLHKMMGIPLICSAFIVKEKNMLEKSFSINADYLFHEENSDYDLGNKSLQCGRRADAFKLWLTWQFEGKLGFEIRVNNLMNKALIFAKKLNERDNFTLFNFPETPIVCFQYHTPDMSQQIVNELNKKIRMKIFAEGEIIFNYAEIKEKTVIRCVISNPEITEEQIDKIIDSIERTGKEILNL